MLGRTLLLVSLVAAGCASDPSPTQELPATRRPAVGEFTTPQGADDPAYAPRILDRTGHLVGFRELTEAERALAAGLSSKVDPVPGNANGLRVTWRATKCHSNPTLTIDAKGPLTISLDRGSTPDTCEPMAIPFAVDLIFDQLMVVGETRLIDFEVGEP